MHRGRGLYSDRGSFLPPKFTKTSHVYNKSLDPLKNRVKLKEAIKLPGSDPPSELPPSLSFWRIFLTLPAFGPLS